MTKQTSQTKKAPILHTYAVFEPAVEGGYNISFPSFPGCVTFGRNLREAKIKAREVLLLWLEELAENQEPVVRRHARPMINEVPVPLPPQLKVL